MGNNPFKRGFLTKRLGFFFNHSSRLIPWDLPLVIFNQEGLYPCPPHFTRLPPTQCPVLTKLFQGNWKPKIQPKGNPPGFKPPGIPIFPFLGSLSFPIIPFGHPLLSFLGYPIFPCWEPVGIPPCSATPFNKTAVFLRKILIWRRKDSFF